MFFTYNARRSYFQRMYSPDGAGSGSAGNGTGGEAGSSGASGSSPSNGGTGSGAEGTGSAGSSDTGGSTSNEGAEGSGSTKLIHGLAPEVWTSLTPSAQEAIKDVAKFRRDLRDTQTKLAEYEKTNTPEAVQLQKQREEIATRQAELDAKTRNANTHDAFTAAAKVAGFQYPELLAAIAGTVASIEWDKDLRPTNVDALIKGVRSKYPNLFTSSDANGGSGTVDTKPNVDQSKLFGSSRLQYAYANPGKKTE